MNVRIFRRLNFNARTPDEPQISETGHICLDILKGSWSVAIPQIPFSYLLLPQVSRTISLQGHPILVVTLDGPKSRYASVSHNMPIPHTTC